MIGIKQRVLLILLFIISLVFIFRLLHLQIFTSDFKLLSEQNIVQENVIFPSRGIVFDRNNKIIVANRAIYDILVVPKDIELEDTTSFLKLFNISKDFFINKIDQAKKYSSIKPSLFYKGISNEEFNSIQQEIGKYPGFSVSAKTIRQYPNKILSHTLGYVGEISPNELKKDSLNYYSSGDFVGISGIEKSYESFLRGNKGYIYKINNVKGESVGDYNDKSNDIVVKRGKDIISTIDIDLQLYIEKLLLNKVGSVVAIEPSSGEILAIASSPSYDPNILTGRFYSENFNLLQKDTLKPLFNRSVSAVYPPGSMFKLIQSLIALEEGVIDPNYKYFINNTTIGDLAPAGLYDLKKAIVLSSNNYFYRLFRKIINQNKDLNTYIDSRIGIDNWNDYVSKFGLGTKINLELNSEAKGFLPNKNYYNDLYGRNRWKFSNIYSLSIGQGELLVSPIQMANLAAIIANRGNYIAPHIIKSVQKDSINFLKLKREWKETLIKKEYYDYIIDAMEEVVSSGSARRAYTKNIKICGKTSTVENPHGYDHSGFIGFAPKNKPKIAIAAYIENAGWGGRAAASISSLAIEYYLNKEIKRKWLESYVLKGEFIDYETK
tara:strand:- start:697 stop:2514 length:1818 start_codon:yes stop_codon:yes gene_type:complete